VICPEPKAQSLKPDSGLPAIGRQPTFSPTYARETLVVLPAGPVRSPEQILEELEQEVKGMNEFQKEGLKEQAGGKAQDIGGKIKEAAGKVTGRADLEAEGEADQAEGSLRDAGGHVTRKVGDAAEDIKDAFKGKE